jgi:hypothetical protein
MSVQYGTYITAESLYADDVVRGLAVNVEPRNTVSWDLFAEDEESDSVTVKWFDSESYDLQGAVGGAGWDATTTAGLAIDADLAAIVEIGDVLKVADEVVVVADVNRSGNTIDVHERGHGSTSGAIHAAAVEIFIIGSAHVESRVDQDGLVEDNVERVNYMQIIQEPVIVSKTSANQKYEDVADKMDEVREKALRRALRKLNLSLLFGEKAARTASKPGSFGGLDYWLRTTGGAVNDDYSGTFTEDKFIATLQRIADRGGAPDTVIMSTTMKGVFNKLNSSYTMTDRSDNGAGTIVDVYNAEGIGTLRLIADPRLDDDHGVMFIVNSRKINKVWFKDDTLRFVEEPANSRTFHETLQGQVTLRMKDVLTDHARVYGL